MPTVQLSARIEKSVKDDLLDICRRTHRSQSYYMEKAFVACHEWEKEYIRKVQEGIDAADRGEMIDDDDPRLDAWIESIGTESELPIPEPIIEPD